MTEPLGAIDCHVDTLLRLVEHDLSPANAWPELQVDVARGNRGGIRLLLTACFTRDGQPEPARAVEAMLDRAQLISEDPEVRLALVTGPASFAALDPDSIGMLPTIENGVSLEGDLDRLAHWKQRGVRVVGLTWNGANALASGVMAREDSGLSELGQDYVREASRLGMALDISHLGPHGVDQLLDSELNAVLATHSNASAVHAHPRNLTDDQLRRLAERDGIVGVNLYPPFLAPATERPVTLNDGARHAAHIASVIGVERVSLGTDLDGIDEFPSGFEGHQDLPAFALALEGVGFARDEVAGILGDNFLRWWSRWSPE